MANPPALLRTPFYEYHNQQNARMVDFAGWEMPLLYKDFGIIPEHEHTRAKASIFDVSHMGRMRISGDEATTFLNRLVTRNLTKAQVGQSVYSLMCRADGGILDDLILSRFDHHWLIVCNAGNRATVLGTLQTAVAQTKGLKVKIQDETLSTAMVAIQGPKAMELLDELLPDPASDLKRYHFSVQRYMMMIQFTVFRSGYTGEDGVEIILGNSAAGMAMKFLASDSGPHAVLRPAGLGARDTLRMEAGMPLYGHELTVETDPLSAGLNWAVDLEKDFVGVEALRRIAAAGGPKRKLVGLFVEGPKSARQGMELRAGGGGAVVGIVTSGTTSPTLKRGIAMAYVDTQLSSVGTKLEVDLRGSAVPAEVTKLPFFSRTRKT